jgi:hypothetical protein
LAGVPSTAVIILGYQVVPLGSDVSCRQNHRTADLSLNRKVVVHGVGQHVVRLEAGRVRNGLEDRKVDVRRRGERIGKALSGVVVAQAILVRLFEVKQGGRCITLPERRIAYLVEQVQIFDGGIVDPGSGPNTRLARSAEDLPQHSLAKSRRIGRRQERSCSSG